eukprot:SAG11_NODE_13952_length_631_cov_1.738722_1_plen_39_part_10
MKSVYDSERMTNHLVSTHLDTSQWAGKVTKWPVKLIQTD